MNVVCAREQALDQDEALRVYRESGLGERRPIDDRLVLSDMLAHANLTITARLNGKLVGLARTLTDFSYVGYLADLAVSREFQRAGIGTRLIGETRAHMGPRAMIVLLAAPAAEAYYEHIGFSPHHSAWILRDSGALRMSTSP